MYLRYRSRAVAGVAPMDPLAPAIPATTTLVSAGNGLFPADRYELLIHDRRAAQHPNMGANSDLTRRAREDIEAVRAALRFGIRLRRDKPGL